MPGGDGPAPAAARRHVGCKRPGTAQTPRGRPSERPKAVSGAQRSGDGRPKRAARALLLARAGGEKKGRPTGAARSRYSAIFSPVKPCWPLGNHRDGGWPPQDLNPTACPFEAAASERVHVGSGPARGRNANTQRRVKPGGGRPRTPRCGAKRRHGGRSEPRPSEAEARRPKPSGGGRGRPPPGVVRIIARPPRNAGKPGRENSTGSEDRTPPGAGRGRGGRRGGGRGRSGTGQRVKPARTRPPLPL